MHYKAPRGTQDILPSEQPYWRFVQEKAQELAERFGYRRIDTPLFEQAGLFVRSVGQGTDIVEKETYTFQDRGGEEMTLRPEGTAPVCRAYIEHGMTSLPQPVRLYYFCPIFRYERPQAGRYRQHYQFGVETIGNGDPAVDAEVIELGWSLMESLGLKGLSLFLNSIGCPACRPGFLKELKAHYLGRLSEVCPDCRMRFERNPLRMLDCKRADFACQPLATGAPRSADRLCADCAAHWASLQGYLAALGIPFQVNPRLVRGLDYYTRTVFEVQPQEEAAQSTILGGGRYDGLIQELGGRPTPGIGFGAGMERLVQNLKRQGVPLPEEERVQALVAYVGDAAREEAVKLASRLRRQGVKAVLAPASKSLKGQLRHATALGARYALILGEDEVRKGTVTVKDMETGAQREVGMGEVGMVVRGK